jgi:nucleoside-diphosphate-sugar epimerase
MYIEDAASALVKLFLSEVQGSVNIASGTSITIKDFVLSIGRQMGCSSAIDFGALPTRPEEPSLLTADVSRLRQEVNFTNQHTLYHGIARTLDWHQATRKSICPQLPTAVYAAATQPANF